MRVMRSVLLLVSGLPILLLFQACSNPGPTRQLLSVSISPVTVTAPGSGQVQFVATGYYNTEPYTVTPLQANWGVEPATGTAQKIVAIAQDGTANCTAGATGTSTVEAWVEILPGGPVCNVIDGAGRPCGSIGASAQLVCP